MGKPKIPAVRVPSDDCVVTVSGVEHRIHEGEWVELLPVPTMREYLAVLDIARELSESKSAATAMDALYALLAKRVLAWNWTDMMGEPLPQPCGNADALKGLSQPELIWLLMAVNGETPSQRKNESAPSANG